jgi:hypothetical protein
MPEMYLKHPNGRILYQLKTYMLKQADIVRRDVYKNIASGEPKRILEGAKNAAALAAIYAVANVPGDVIKDFLSDREVDPLNTPRLVENVLQTFGLNRYTTGNLAQGKVVGVLQNTLTPPLKVFEDVARTVHQAAGNGAAPETDWKGVSYVPLVGRIVYDRGLYGNERKEIAEKIMQNKSALKADRVTYSDEAKAYLKLKRDAAKRLKAERERNAE